MMTGQHHAGLILYIEDNDDDSFLLRHALKTSGVTCHLEVASTAAAARDFLTRIAPACPDLIICDLGLAGTSGLDALEWVRKQAHLANVLVMLVSGSLPTALRARASDLGVQVCLEKSMDWRELARQIVQLLPSKQ